MSRIELRTTDAYTKSYLALEQGGRLAALAAVARLRGRISREGLRPSRRELRVPDEFETLPREPIPGMNEYGVEQDVMIVCRVMVWENGTSVVHLGKIKLQPRGGWAL